MATMARALIFDLDGTLIDTVYAHVFAWQRALAEAGLPIEGWRIHRRIGMSGGLCTRAVARELGRPLRDAEVEQIQRTRWSELYRLAERFGVTISALTVRLEQLNLLCVTPDRQLYESKQAATGQTSLW